MRLVLIAVNLLVAAASAGLFGYTFFARGHLVGLAQEFVVGKTVQHIAPAVEIAENALKQPAAAALVPAAIREAVQAEIDSFRKDSSKYVRDLVARGAAVAPPKHPLADKVAAIKEDIRRYFDTTLAGLIRDVRIFSGTNLVAALLAAGLAARARGRWRYHILVASLLLLIALGFNIYMFIDGLTFFRILFDICAGWTYLLFVVLMFAALYIEYGRHVPLAAAESDVSVAGPGGTGTAPHSRP